MTLRASSLILEYATTYEMPGTALDYFVVLIGAAGLLLILFEEEHLHRVFGARYAEYCRAVSRHL